MSRTSLSSGFITAGIGLTLSLALVLPAGAADEAPAPTRAGAITAVDAQPVVRPIDRPVIDVIPISCEADGTTVGCSWRATTAESAAGYQLWRIVDRGEREYVWRGGVDTTSARDSVPADAVVVRYAVLAVDADGNVVGQSRPIALRLGETDGPVAVRSVAVRASIPWANTYR